MLLTKSLAKANYTRMGISDQRGKKINEIISGIKIIKFNAWEKMMNSMTQNFRRKEGTYISRIFLLRGLADGIVTFIPVLIGLITFPIYDLIYPDDPLNVS